MESLILFGITLALGLAFVNGLNDASHSIATVVATRALSPAKAVFLTAICNMLGPFIFTTAVAATIGTTIVNKSALTPSSIIVAMAAAILLIVVATRIGIPLSSSNAMVGGLMGAGVAAGGIGAIILPGTNAIFHVVLYSLTGGVAGALILAGLTTMIGEDVRFGAVLGAICGAALVIPLLMVAGVLKLSGLLVVVLFILISPILGMVTAFVFDIIITHLFRHSRQNRMKRIFQPLHILACLLQAAAHGGNDGQNAVGLITALLVASGILAELCRAALGYPRCRACHRPRDLFWRLAGSGKDGTGYYEDPTVPGILCRHRQQRDACYGNIVRYSRFLDARDQRGDYRCRCNPGKGRGPVACRSGDDDRMDHHYPAGIRMRIHCLPDVLCHPVRARWRLTFVRERIRASPISQGKARSVIFSGPGNSGSTVRSRTLRTAASSHRR